MIIASLMLGIFNIILTLILLFIFYKKFDNVENHLSSQLNKIEILEEKFETKTKEIDDKLDQDDKDIKLIGENLEKLFGHLKSAYQRVTHEKVERS